MFNHVEVKFFIFKCLVQFCFSSDLIRLLEFLIYSVITVNTVLFVVRVLFLLFSVIFVSDVCLSIYYACLLLCLLLVCWVRENLFGGPGHIFSVWDSAVWSAGPVQFFSGTFWSGWRDCTGFSLFCPCCSGCGTVEMVGGVWLSFHFLYFVLVLLVGGRLW